MNQRHLDFKHVIKTQNDLLYELVDSYVNRFIDMESYYENLFAGREYMTLEELLNTKKGASRNVKYTALVISGTLSYTALSRRVGLTVPRLRQIVYNTIKKINPDLVKLYLPDLRKRKIEILKALLSM